MHSLARRAGIPVNSYKSDAVKLGFGRAPDTVARVLDGAVKNLTLELRGSVFLLCYNKKVAVSERTAIARVMLSR